MPPPSLAAATAQRGRRVAPGERHGRLSVSRSSQRAVYFTLWAPAGRVRKAERKCGRATEVLGEKTRESEAAGDAPGTQRNRQSFHTAQVGSGGRSIAGVSLTLNSRARIAPSRRSRASSCSRKLRTRSRWRLMLRPACEVSARRAPTPESLDSCGAGPPSQQPMKAGSGWKATPLDQLH